MAWNGKMNAERVAKAAKRLLSLVPVSSAPVPVEQIAQACGIVVRRLPYESSLASLLLWEEGRAVIGVNALHSAVRQRFAIAHELAHVELRHYPGIHVDRTFPVPMLTQYAGQEIDPRELEASAVALEVLAPFSLLEDDVRGQAIDYLDDAALRVLADRYQVSFQAMLLRLLQAGLVAPSA